MSVRLPPHAHCVNCENPIPEDEKFCSEECEQAFLGRSKKEKNKNALFYILVLGSFVLVWIFIAFLS